MTTKQYARTHNRRAGEGGQVMSTHTPGPCKRQNIVHYSGKSYSDAFKCPMCGRVGRYNLSFLGSRNVVCDGSKFTKEAR